MSNKLNTAYLVFIYLFALTSCFSISAMSIDTGIFLLLFIIALSLNYKSLLKYIPKDFSWFVGLYAYRALTLIINNSIQHLARVQEIFDKSPYLSLSVAKLEKKHFERVIYTLFITNSAVILYAIGEKYLSFPIIYRSLFKDDRLSGFFAHALQYAGYESIVAVLAFVLGIFYKRTFLYFFPVLFGGIILSGSRSYILSVIFVIILVSFLKSFRIALVSTISSLGLILIYTFLNPSFKQRLYFLFHPTESSSITSRFNLWDKSWDVFLQHPIFGVGYQNLPLYLKEIYEKGLTTSIAHAHNIYLNELAEGGIIGFILAIGMLIYFVYKYLKEYKNCDDLLYKVFALGLSMVFINIMIAGIFEYNLGTAVVWMLLTFLMGIYLAYKNTLDENEKRNT